MWQWRLGDEGASTPGTAACATERRLHAQTVNACMQRAAHTKPTTEHNSSAVRGSPLHSCIRGNSSPSSPRDMPNAEQQISPEPCQTTHCDPRSTAAGRLTLTSPSGTARLQRPATRVLVCLSPSACTRMPARAHVDAPTWPSRTDKRAGAPPGVSARPGCCHALQCAASVSGWLSGSRCRARGAWPPP